MNDILQEIFIKKEPQRRFCSIVRILNDGRYLVQDDQGRKITVDGDNGYLPGNNVIVQSMRIVGSVSYTHLTLPTNREV